jgi:YebC/PmpR family DNA-binding regulatory protein
MAGHSKWKNIQHRKNAQDSKRGKIFTKLIREITVAARQGGEDPDTNPRLRTAIDKALGNNMTRDTIDRAIKRGVGQGDGNDMMEVRYEGYAPAGVAVIVECLTDNKNRTVAEVRHAFTKCGGNLGTDGSVAYLFNETGLISFDAGNKEAEILEVAIEAGADDVVTNSDQSIDVLTPPHQFGAVKDAFEKRGLKFSGAEIRMLPVIEVAIDDQEQAEQIIRLSDMLEDLDDVQSVYTNVHIPDSILENL